VKLPRVLIVTSFPFPHVGGASTVIEALAARLQARDMLAGLVSSDRVPPCVAQRLLYPPFRAVLSDRARAWKLRAAVDRLAEAVGRQPEVAGGLIIHCHDAAATRAALRGAPPRSTVIQTVHGPWSREAQAAGIDPRSRLHGAIRELEAGAYAGAALLLPVGRGQADILAEDFGVPPARIRVVNNGVDVERIRLLAGGSVPPNLPERYFVVPRRLTAKNGVEVAIRALAALGRDDVDLAIAGDGELRRPLGELAHRIGVAGRVHFLGSLSQHSLFPIVRGSVAVLVPSVPTSGVVEPFSLSVLEGMACGSPVIGSSIGGNTEMLVDGESGYLVPSDDSEALAGAMRRVLGLDGQERAALVERALARAGGELSATAWFTRTCAIYEELTHGGG